MKKLLEFLKINKNIAVWTLCYILAAFLIFQLIFGFNLFSPHHWAILLGARLRGFPGLAFGVFLVALIPVYIATAAIIIRTGKPLFTIIPKKKKSEKPKDEKPVVKKQEELPLPVGIPSELVGAFMRARRNIGNRPLSAFDMKDVYINSDIDQTDVPKHPDPELPLPENFDFGANTEATTTPMFKEIDFSAPADKSPDADQTILTQQAEYSLHDEIKVSNGMAIVIHSDPDFWIADEEHWFAAGKQKVSPIAQALAAAEKHELSPAIYLAEKNIMDLDNQIKNWESRGIRVITDPSEIE